MIVSSAKIFDGHEIFLDELNAPAFVQLIWFSRPKKIIVLDKIKIRQRIFAWILSMRGLLITEADFFAGDLKLNNEAVALMSHKYVADISLKASKMIISSSSRLTKINALYGRNTIQLHVAKNLQNIVNYWVLRILIVRTYSSDAQLLIKKPNMFSSQLLELVSPEISICLYQKDWFRQFGLVKLCFLEFARTIKLQYGNSSAETKKTNSSPASRPSVLMLQEDTVRFDKSLRGQPHWIDNQSNPFDTNIIEMDSNLFSTRDIELLEKSSVYVISKSLFKTARRITKGNQVFKVLRLNRYKALLGFLTSYHYVDRYFLLKIMTLLKQAELMGALALLKNTKVFLYRETYYPLVDAMVLVAPKLNIKTIAYQYSNLGCISPVMMSTSDKFLIFSDIYNSVYKTDDIIPGEFIVVGYLYDYVAKLVLSKAKNHRKILSDLGATFIICYFNESVQGKDRWGLISENNHLEELHVLAKAVLDDATFAVITKSQFMRTSHSNLYSTDKLLKKATETGRFIELGEGFRRNDIFPAEAALASDLCISHKFGATAALEAVVSGVKTVLLDSYGTKTVFDSIYRQADIEYASVELIMAAVTKYREGDLSSQQLGDWSKIIHYFDPHVDGNASARLRNEVLESIKRS